MCIAIALPIAGLAFSYQKKLENGTAMGGAISNSKLFWLFFALSIYFVFNPLVAFFTDAPEAGKQGLKMIFYLMLVRGIFQYVGMYVTKNWTPKIGIILNIIGVLLAAYWLINGYADAGNLSTLFSSSAYILLIINFFCFVFDLYYAYIIDVLVGEGTKGEQPVWYANSKDRKFAVQNKITFSTNVFLSILFIYFVFIS